MKRMVKLATNKYSLSVTFAIILRLIFGPLIFFSIWITVIANFIIDWSDGEVFKRSVWKRQDYSWYDKVLDQYWYCFILGYIFYINTPGKWLFLSLFVYRTIGFLLYLKTKKEILFQFFPNLFEIFFFFYLLTTINPQLVKYLEMPKAIYPLVVIIPTVLVREYLLHVKNMNLSWFFTGKTTYWVDDKKKR